MKDKVIKRSESFYIIAYDIRTAKVRTKIVKLLTDLGMSRVNKSVFEGVLPKNQFSKILKSVHDLIGTHDEVVAYPITFESIRTKTVLKKLNTKKEDSGPIII